MALLASVVLGIVPAGLAWAQDGIECRPGTHLEGGHLRGPPPGIIVGGHCVKNPLRPAAGTIFVDWQNLGFQDGTAEYPYEALPPALGVAAPGDTIAIRTGSYNLEGGLLNKSATIRADNGLVTITGKPSLGGTGHLPFDLVSRSSDLNDLPRNPTWGYLVDRGSLPDAVRQCKVSDNAADWYLPPEGCTHDHVTVDKKWWDPLNCQHGHVNWSAATYEGIVFWQDHSASDDDYDIVILRPDQALYTRSNSWYVLMEFDSDETIDHFDAQHWWKNFHNDVDGDNRKAVGPFSSGIGEMKGHAATRTIGCL